MSCVDISSFATMARVATMAAPETSASGVEEKPLATKARISDPGRSECNLPVSAISRGKLDVSKEATGSP